VSTIISNSLKKEKYNQKLSSTPLQFSLPETISRLAKTGDVTAGPTVLIMRSFWTGGRRTGGQGRPPGQAEAASPALGVAHFKSEQKFVGIEYNLKTKNMYKIV